MRGKRVVSIGFTGLFIGVLSVSVAMAQQTRPYQPAPPPAPPPGVQPNGGYGAPNGVPGATAPAPNGNGQQQMMPPPPPINGGYYQSYYPEYYSYGTAWPGVEVRAIPSAVTRRAIARAEYRRLQSGLSLMILEMRKAFERSREYASAVSEEREAFEELERARNEALQSLRDDPHYQASVALRQELTDQIADRREDRYHTMDEIMAMAQVKMSYASTASQMERAALAADPDVQQARERLRQAATRVAELRLQYDQNIRTSPELEVARRNLQDARIAKLAAEVYAEAVVDVADAALDYAYYTHRYDLYKYLSYGYYGYNYPVYGGRRVGYPIGYPYGY